MDQEKKKVLLKYLACFGIASAMLFIFFAIKGFDFGGLKSALQLLCDAFFVVGALWLLFAGFVYVSGEGVFFGLGFAFKGMLGVFVPHLRDNRETFRQYRERKLEEHKSKVQGCIVITGLVLLAIGFILLIIWHQL